MKYKNNGVFKELLPVAKEGIKYEGTYEVAPTGWSIVSSEEDCTNNSILYFITDAKSSSEEIVYQPAHIYAHNENTTVMPFTGYVKILIQPEGGDIVEYDCPNSASTVEQDIQIPTSVDFKVGIRFWFTYSEDSSENVYLQANFKNPSYEWNMYNEVPMSKKETNDLIYWFDDTNSYPSGASIMDLLRNSSDLVFETWMGISTGGMACLAEDTEIATIDGFEKIKDLKLGDKVLDENDEETTIEKIYGHIIYNPYVITLDNNETIVCSHDHKFKTQNGIKTADSLTLEDTLYDYRIVNISVKNKEQNVYEIRTTSENYRLANGIVCECEVI